MLGQGGGLACRGSHAQLPCAPACGSVSGRLYGASSGHSARRVAAPAVHVRAGYARAAAPVAAPTGACHAVAASRLASSRAASRPSAARDGEAAQAEPQKRRQKAPRVGELGETTADGRPKPDERTVADLVERGWFETEEAAVTLLTRRKTGVNRFAFETAKPAADWLEATLGRVPVKGGVLPAAKAVKLCPQLLQLDAATLQRKWVALTLPTEQGGVGCMLSEEQGREAVLKYPQILGYATEKLKRGWSMLTATEGGLGLSREEARSCILRTPNVLLYDHDDVVRRVELLMSLGYPEAYEMVLTEPRVLNFKEESVRKCNAWWKQSGLDHLKINARYPTLLAGVPVEELQAKLSFLRDVARLSVEDLNRGGPFLQPVWTRSCGRASSMLSKTALLSAAS